MYFHSLDFLTRRFGKLVLDSDPISSPVLITGIPEVVPLPADLSAITVVPFGVPASSVNAAVDNTVGLVQAEASASFCPEDFDAPLSKLVAGRTSDRVQNERVACSSGTVAGAVESLETHVGEEPPPARKDVCSGRHPDGPQKTTFPRFSSFLPNFDWTFGSQRKSPVVKGG